MPNNDTFEIFGFDHISTIVLILGISVIIPFLLKGYSRKDLRLLSLILALIIVSSIVFIVGFAKSSRENEYKKLMDSFIERKEESD